MMADTANAPERIWATPSDGYCTATDIKSATRDALGFREYVLSTHCDELVAAAYLNAAQRIEQCLWSQHWYLDGESVDPEDLSEGITKRTPDDARAALTAYGERMKAEGASEAQAKIARLTEALAIAGPIALKVFDYHLFTLDAEDQRKVETIRAALQENSNE